MGVFFLLPLVSVAGWRIDSFPLQSDDFTTRFHSSILGDPGAESGAREVETGEKKSGRRKVALTFPRPLFFCPFRHSLARQSAPGSPRMPFLTVISKLFSINLVSMSRAFVYLKSTKCGMFQINHWKQRSRHTSMDWPNPKRRRMSKICVLAVVYLKVKPLSTC